LTRGGNLHLSGPAWSQSFVRRSAAGLAMLALLLQIAASFGHMHARDFAGGTDRHDAAGWHVVTTAKAALPSHDKLADDEDRCAICFSDFLLAASSVPHVAHPAAPIRPSIVNYVRTRTAFLLPHSGKAFFRSRAPPAA
jgi:hypothetical protein